jgi:predicted esterase
MKTTLQSVATVLACMMSVIAPALGDTVDKHVALPIGKDMNYVTARPEGFKEGDAAPVVIALGGGPQTAQMAMAALSAIEGPALSKGWVVIAPSTPDARLFCTGAEEFVPALLRDVRTWVRPEGNKFHILGFSNGGNSAFRLAINWPEQFHSVLVMPGQVMNEDWPRFERMRAIPVRAWVGANDTVVWTDGAAKLEREGKKLKMDVQVQTIANEGHMIRSVSGAKLVETLEGFRVKEGTLAGPALAVLNMLDEFHEAASKAEEAKYFALFAPEGVFIGTDAGERWNVEEFRAYARPFFSKGRGWTYKPRAGTRHVDVSADGQMAWFDELLDNDKYGLCRGSGVARMISGRWRICQYHLTVPVPNELLDRVAKLIKLETKKPGK